MKFATYLFRIAGAYGLLVTFPLYFMEQKMGIDYPPPINHAENYYAFIGVTVAWQILFLVIARDPLRYRTIMLVCFLEKMSLVPAFLILFPQGRFPALLIPLMIIDLTFGLLFLVSYFKTKNLRKDSAAT
jgi:hypothetical protein